MSSVPTPPPPLAPAIEVRALSFRYRKPTAVPSRGSQDPGREVLSGVDLTVAAGSRCLMLGANGAGKTTLLRVLGGKHMVDSASVRVLGTSAFHDTSLAGRVELLSASFPFDIDLRVAEILEHAIDVDAARRDHLIELLGVDREWHMHAVSDGQRRRVQLLLGLMRPREVLLLDEITTDLDLLARQDLLAFLRKESEQRGATILYATHILDSLDEWATHLCYLCAGRVQVMAPLAEVDELTTLRAAGQANALLHLLDRWLRRDRALARASAATS